MSGYYGDIHSKCLERRDVDRAQQCKTIDRARRLFVCCLLQAAVTRVPESNSPMATPDVVVKKRSLYRWKEKITCQRRHGAILLIGIFLVLGILAEPCESFSMKRPSGSTRRSKSHDSISNQSTVRKSTSRFASVSTENGSLSTGSIQMYEHDGWTLTYRYKAASPGYESDSPLLLIHPVGIGLSSWFWEKFFQEWQGSELYAPDLIGCGVKNGGDAWDPHKRGLLFPLSWVQGCETLMQRSRTVPQFATVLNALPLPKSTFPSMRNDGHWIVVCQGGLAPVGVMLAARNPTTVSKLVLTSPPTWKDMTVPVPEVELSRNYNFLRSPLVEPAAFGILESRWAIAYFSNLFLFQGKCDQQWLDFACNEIARESRPPVAAFNAGFCNHRSFQEELETLEQPTLILSGDSDAERSVRRKEYQSNMKDSTLMSLPGKNMLPWESPEQVCNAVKEFCY